MIEAAKLGAGIIAEEMVWRGPHPAKVDVVKPRGERGNALFQVVARDGAQPGFNDVHPRVGSVLQ